MLLLRLFGTFILSACPCAKKVAPPAEGTCVELRLGVLSGDFLFFFFLYYVSLQYEHKSHNKKIRNKPRRGMARMAISDLVDQWPEFSRVIKISEG